MSEVRTGHPPGMPSNTADTPLFSVVIPIFNEEDNLEELHRRLTDVLVKYEGGYEIILVDDGSRDTSADLIRQLSSRDRRVRGIRFSRNFGQHIAITAGLDESSGECVLIMDGDLQDQPEAIPALYGKLREGFDVVYGVRVAKQHSVFKRVTSWMFLKVMRAITTEEAEITTGIYRIMTREVADAVCQCREQARFVVGLFNWVGFRQTSMEVPHGGRFAGETKYSLLKMIKLAMNGITAFSKVPLQIASLIGTAVSIWAFAWGGWLILRKVIWNTAVPGWTSTMVVLLLLSGVQLLSLGVIGSYIGRIYGEAQRRPLYIVAERFGNPRGD